MSESRSNRIKKYRAIGYHWYQTNIGKLEDLVGNIQTQITTREQYIAAIHEGVELAIWENDNNMEDEQVTEEYKELVNLGYILSMEGGQQQYQSLMDLILALPPDMMSFAHDALEAGRKQAELDRDREANAQYQDHLKDTFKDNTQEQTQDDRYDGHDEKVEAVRVKEENEQLDRQTSRLTPDQIKELQDFENRTPNEDKMKAAAQRRTAMDNLRESDREYNQTLAEKLTMHQQPGEKEGFFQKAIKNVKEFFNPADKAEKQAESKQSDIQKQIKELEGNKSAQPATNNLQDVSKSLDETAEAAKATQDYAEQKQKDLEAAQKLIEEQKQRSRDQDRSR